MKMKCFFIKFAFDFQIVQQYNLCDKINERDNLRELDLMKKNWQLSFHRKSTL